MNDIPNALPWLVLCALILSPIALTRFRRKQKKDAPQIDTEAFRKFVGQKGRTLE